MYVSLLVEAARITNEHVVQVFPGGNFDGKQDKSLAMTAIRETFEESGLLLASSSLSTAPPPLEADLDKARHDIHQQKLLFQQFLQSKNLEADVESLLPFTQWITPAKSPR
jgi:8-oxo-dGTP pyrophosphatase MutT (NUDIX family)